MKQLRKSAFLGLMAASVIFHAGSALAIPIPTIGAELPNQIAMLQKHLEELKKFKDQITNGIDQAKSMGDKMSMDALKGQLTSMAKDGGVNKILGDGLKVPDSMKKTGYSEDVAKDPDKTKGWVENNMKQEEGSYDPEKQVECQTMKNELQDEINTSTLARSLALQNNLAGGQDFADAQQAASGATDQMQQIGANTAVLLKMYQVKATDTSLMANESARTSLSGMCR